MGAYIKEGSQMNPITTRLRYVCSSNGETIDVSSFAVYLQSYLLIPNHTGAMYISGHYEGSTETKALRICQASVLYLYKSDHSEDEILVPDSTGGGGSWFVVTSLTDFSAYEIT